MTTPAPPLPSVIAASPMRLAFFDAFDVKVAFDKANRKLTLAATLTGELVSESERTPTTRWPVGEFVHTGGSAPIAAARFYEAKWRDSERRQAKQRLGRTWLERTPDGGSWRARPRQPAEGFLDERQARAAIAAAIVAHKLVPTRGPLYRAGALVRWRERQAQASGSSAASPRTFHVAPRHQSG